MGKPWTQEEIDYLCDKYGTTSIPKIAKNLNRSEQAVKMKSTKLHLGAFLEAGEYITFVQLLKTLGYTNSDNYKVKSWIQKRNFPVRMKRVINNKFRVVQIDDFWEWAEKNQDLLDFSRFEINALGREPEWVNKKRTRDVRLAQKFPRKEWTPEEDSRLIALLKQQKYTYRELSNLIGRTEGAIQRRCNSLNIKDRPVRIPAHDGKWTEADLEILTYMILDGYKYETMPERLDKSVKAIRGKVYAIYKTERLDVVREKLKKEAG